MFNINNNIFSYINKSTDLNSQNIDQYRNSLIFIGDERQIYVPATNSYVGTAYSLSSKTYISNVANGNMTYFLPVLTGNAPGRYHNVYVTWEIGVNPYTGKFVGGLQGEADYSTYSKFSYQNIIYNTTKNSTYYITFSNKNSGTSLTYVNNDLKYNPSTKTLSSTYFSGYLNGWSTYSTYSIYSTYSTYTTYTTYSTYNTYQSIHENNINKKHYISFVDDNTYSLTYIDTYLYYNPYLNALGHGTNVSATGEGSHAEGGNTIASGKYSHTEGNTTTASKNNAHAEGYLTYATGESSHAEGIETEAKNKGSHAEGSETIANADYSHTEGIKSKTTGKGAHAEGSETKAFGQQSHAEGSESEASGKQSHAEGYKTIANADNSHAEGNESEATNNNAHAEGYKSNATGKSSHAEGSETYATAEGSHAEGCKTNANGQYSHAEGYKSETNNKYAHAEGNETKALGESSHAEGRKTTASGKYSHAEGDTTTASGDYSHASGCQTKATGQYSVVSGYKSQANGVTSWAGGNVSITNGTYNFAFGNNIKTSNENEVSFGKYNKTNSDTAFSIGGGTSSTRSNLLEVTTSGLIKSIGGFNKVGYDDNYILLAGGGVKLESNLIVSNADTVDGFHANTLFQSFTGGKISSTGNVLTQENHSIKIGGTTYSAGSSTANIINSAEWTYVGSLAYTNSTYNLVLRYKVNGINSSYAYIPKLTSYVTSYIKQGSDYYQPNTLFTQFDSQSQLTTITIGGKSRQCNIDADTVDGFHANKLFQSFTGGKISSVGNILTQENHNITIGGTSYSYGYSTANIINSANWTYVGSLSYTNSTYNLVLRYNVNGVDSSYAYIPKLISYETSYIKQGENYYQPNTLFTQFDSQNHSTTITIGGKSRQCDIDAYTLEGYRVTDLDNRYVNVTGDTMTGPLTINSSVNNNYNEGIRITRAANKWAGITFGSTGTSGAPTGGWFVATNPSNQFIINPDNSGNTDGLCLNKNGDAKWRNNIIWHEGNDGAGSGLDADLIDGYDLDDLLPYGLENICESVSGGGQTILNNDGSISTTGINGDTYYYITCTEKLEAGQPYTFGFYVTGIPDGNTKIWNWGIGSQNNSNFTISVQNNGWCWGTGTFENDIPAGSRIIIDDINRNFYNAINLSKFVMVKGRQRAYYTPPISKMEVNHATYSTYSMYNSYQSIFENNTNKNYYISFVNNTSYSLSYIDSSLYYNPYLNALGHGTNVSATGEGSHAEGGNTTASGKYSHAEGNTTTANKTNAHAEGNTTTASGESSHAEGIETEAKNKGSHTEGSKTIANADYSHAEGIESTTTGKGAHAEGNKTEASGQQSHAEGSESEASGKQSHAEGFSTLASADNSHAEGNESEATNNNAHAEGYKSNAAGKSSHAEGSETDAIGEGSHAEGCKTYAGSQYSHAEGYKSETNNKYAHAEGNETMASGESSHAEGRKTTASGKYSHTEGDTTTASGDYSHASGCQTKATGDYTFVIGYKSQSNNMYSFAGGNTSIANGQYNFAFGNNIKTSNENEVSFGKYNKTNSDTVFSIGGGTSSTRSNLLEVTTSGLTKSSGGFNKVGYDDTYVLLAGGGHKLESNLTVYSATKLATTRTLWGQSFDGTANVSGNMSSVGNISFSASGKNIGSILYFDTTNSRLGVGTSSPSYKLHVAGDIYTTTGFKKANSSDSYVLLGGGGHMQFSTSNIGNTLISRDGNGDFAGRHFISNINDENIEIGSVFIRSNIANDNYVRRISFSNFLSKIYSNETTTFTKSLTVTEAWMDTGIELNDTNFPNGSGTYAIQVTYEGSDENIAIYSGIVSICIHEGNNAVAEGHEEEIMLHASGGHNTERIYLKMIQNDLGSGSGINGGFTTFTTYKLQIATNNPVSKDITFKFRKLI